MRKWLALFGVLLLLTACSGAKRTEPTSGAPNQSIPGGRLQAPIDLPVSKPQQQGGSVPEQQAPIGEPNATQPGQDAPDTLAERMERMPAPALTAGLRRPWTGGDPTHRGVTSGAYEAKLVPRGGAWVLSLTKRDSYSGQIEWETEGTVRHPDSEMMGQLLVGIESRGINYLSPMGEVQVFDSKTGTALGITRLPVFGTGEVGGLSFVNFGYGIANLGRSTGGARRFSVTVFDTFDPEHSVEMSAEDFDVAASPYGSALLGMRENQVTIYRDGREPLTAKWPIRIDSRLFAYFSRWNDDVLVIGEDLTLGRIDGTLVAHLPKAGEDAIPAPGEAGAWVKQGPSTWSYWQGGKFHGTVTLPAGYTPHWEALPEGYLLVPLVQQKGVCTFTTGGELFGCFKEVHHGEPNASYWWGVRDGQLWNFGRGA